MKTDDLIDALAAGLEPARPARPIGRLLLVAAVAAVLAVVLLLGVRPDIVQAVQSPTPWLKALYTLSLTAAALALVTAAGRPGVDMRRALLALAIVIGLALLWGAIELLAAPPGERLADWLGRTWTVCGRNIVMVAAATAPFVFLSARRLAPTRPAACGAALGVVAGGIAATAYGVLHCPEATAAFVATWYTLGVLAAGTIGAFVGRFALRW